MTPTIQIEQTLRRLERAAGYLRLMERCKETHRNRMRDAADWDRDGLYYIAKSVRKQAAKYARLYLYIQDRYNQCVCDSLIIAPHMITT